MKKYNVNAVIATITAILFVILEYMVTPFVNGYAIYNATVFGWSITVKVGVYNWLAIIATTGGFILFWLIDALNEIDFCEKEVEA